MFEWLSANLATILVAAAVFGVFAAIVACGIRNRKRGKSSCSCGGGCGGCACSGICHGRAAEK